MSLATLAGRAVPVTPPELLLGELLLPDALITMKATTIATTTITLPAVISARLRTSARRAAARCAAIFSLAFCCLSLVALLMPALPHPSGFLWPDNGTCVVPLVPHRPRTRGKPPRQRPPQTMLRRGGAWGYPSRREPYLP